MKRKKTPSHDFDEIIPLLVGMYRRLSKEKGPPDHLQTREFRRVVACVKECTQIFQNGFEKSGKDYSTLFSDPWFKYAYLLYFWPLRVQEGLSLIGEIPETPRRVLDVSAKGAPYSFAALRHGASNVIATDPNIELLQAGAEVAGRYGLAMDVRRWDCTKTKCPVEGKFDLIILEHCLSEIFVDSDEGFEEKQRVFVEHLLDKIDKQGYLLIVDGSLKKQNHRILKLRDTLIDSGFVVQAPCVYRGACPALLANQLCYAQRPMEKPYLIKEIQRAADINLSSLKMSYTLFRGPNSDWPGPASSPLYRVISPPIESHMGSQFYLCGTEGKFALSSRVEAHDRNSIAYEYLKRGELISIENPLKRNRRLEVTEDTKIKVDAALGKPYIHKEPDE